LASKKEKLSGKLLSIGVTATYFLLKLWKKDSLSIPTAQSDWVCFEKTDRKNGII